MRTFTFAELLSHSDITRSQAINLTAKRVLIPDVEDPIGTGHQRRFSLFNLFEAKVAATLIPVGVEHYAIAQILRALRWVIGDPRGLETWFETYFATPTKQRDRFDRRLLRAQLVERVNRFTTWLADPDLDLSSLSEEDRAFMLDARRRVQQIAPQTSNDTQGTYRAIGRLMREMPLVRRGTALWESLKASDIRTPVFLLAWPEYHGGEFTRYQSSVAVRELHEGWVIRLAEVNEIATVEAVQDGSAVTMISLLPLIEQLEADTGERFDDAETARALTWTAG